MLVAGCGGQSQPPVDDVGDSQSTFTGESFLPDPSTLKLPTVLSSDLVTVAADYEQDLPHAAVSLSGDLLYLTANWSKKAELAYAMYWVRVPDYEHKGIIQLISDNTGFHCGGIQYLYTLAADFTNDCWNLISNYDSAHYDPYEYNADHVNNGCLLVAVVATSKQDFYGLLAGDLKLPHILKPDPKLVMSGDQIRFSGQGPTYINQEMVIDSISWDFGGGAIPNQSSDLEPLVTIAAPGLYTGEIVTANAAGETTMEFSYTVIPACFPRPLYLYAFPSQEELLAGDDVMVTIITGPFPAEEPCCNPCLAILLSEDVEFVGGSFNLGAPGGEKMDPDGFWEQMADDIYGWVIDPDDWIVVKDTETPGIVSHSMVFAPIGGEDVTGGGELCNFRLRFPNPGTYSIGFQEREFDNGTYYKAYGGDGTWYDISNSVAANITVLPHD